MIAEKRKLFFSLLLLQAAVIAVKATVLCIKFETNLLLLAVP